MKRTHMFIPEQDIERLKRLSAETGLSVSELIRRAVGEYLGKNK